MGGTNLPCSWLVCSDELVSQSSPLRGASPASSLPAAAPLPPGTESLVLPVPGRSPREPRRKTPSWLTQTGKALSDESPQMQAGISLPDLFSYFLKSYFLALRGCAILTASVPARWGGELDLGYTANRAAEKVKKWKLGQHRALHHRHRSDFSPAHPKTKGGRG